MIRLPTTLRPARWVNWPWAGLLLFLVLLTSACSRASVSRGAPVVPSPLPSATAAPQAPETIARPLAATATLIVAEPSSTPVTQATCDLEYFFDPAPDSCPAALPAISAAAEQPFEGGVLIWLEETDSVIVFYAGGRWQRFDDTWTADQPESDPALVPPAGRFQPIRGFGKVWRERPEVRELLGWALGVELGFESTIQDQATLPDQPDLTYLLTYNGQVFALIERGLDEGDWVLAADDR